MAVCLCVLATHTAIVLVLALPSIPLCPVCACVSKVHDYIHQVNMGLFLASVCPSLLSLFSLSAGWIMQSKPRPDMFRGKSCHQFWVAWCLSSTGKIFYLNSPCRKLQQRDKTDITMLCPEKSLRFCGSKPSGVELHRSIGHPVLTACFWVSVLKFQFFSSSFFIWSCQCVKLPRAAVMGDDRLLLLELNVFSGRGLVCHNMSRSTVFLLKHTHNLVSRCLYTSTL